jgi:hypothetical protein
MNCCGGGLVLQTLAAARLFLFHTHTHTHTQVVFIPEPELWDEKGMRMPLEDSRHSTETVAHVEVSLVLHVPPEPLPIMPLATPPEKISRRTPPGGRTPPAGPNARR